MRAANRQLVGRQDLGFPVDKVVAGKAEVLKAVPKKFATFLKVDANDKVTLRLEGEDKDTTWSVKPDAEIKVMGWWGRLDQIQQGDRVWVWFTLNRNKKPKSILMLADVYPGVRVLESGVGSGALSMTMVRAGASVVGYELREEFAAKAERNVRTFLGLDD